MEFDIARVVLEALESEGVRYAVFGAVAVNLHGLARSTEDLDLFIAPERDNVDRLKKDTVRAKDKGDAEALRLRFRLGDG